MSAGIGFGGQGSTYVTKVGSGLGPRTLICTIVKDSGDATEAELSTVLRALGQAGGSGNGSDTNGPDAFTVAAVSGTIGTDPVYVALQGTGTPNTIPVTGFTLAVVATFDQNPA
jgi:hypothetical protein